MSTKYPRNTGMAAKRVRTPEDGATLLLASLFGRGAAPPEWHDDAACRDAPHEPWVAEPNDPTTPRKQQRLIREYCNRCPVLEQCRNDALEWARSQAGRGPEAALGVAGGMVARERWEAVQEMRRTGEHGAA